MAASTNDLLKKAGASTVTTLSAPGKALAATSINVGSTTNYPADTGIVIAIRQVDSNGKLIAGTYTEWSATVASATSLSIVAVPVYGSDQIYGAGSTTQVYIPLSSYAHNKLIDNILEHANQDGTLITQAVRDALNLDSGSSDGWTPFGYSLTSITALGNRSYTAVVSGVDTTAVTSVGMRLKLPRTVTAPTGALTLNGTTQYANKTSPTGMTFTDDFVVSAIVPALTSYSANTMTIASRYNGTSGWSMQIEASTGRVVLVGYNGSSANNSYVRSMQSVPLNKEFKVAALLDMSAFTAAAATAETAKSWVMIDGLEVPAEVARNGTNPTALPTQVGNLEIGSRNATDFFQGKLVQVAIYSTRVLQATIRASQNQTLTGSETSLISAYKLDQASGLNDLSANANNLTAQGSPTYTATSGYFTNPVTGTSVTAGTTNYGIIMAQTFSTNTTYTIQVPEGETLPTTGGIGPVSYSTQKTPYGFPGQRGKWRISYIRKDSGAAVTSNATFGAYHSNSWAFSVPTGEWDVGISINGAYSGSTTAIHFSLSSTALTGLTQDKCSDIAFRLVASSASAYTAPAYVKASHSLSSMTTYIIYTLGATTGGGIDSSSTSNEMFAENSYL